MPVQTLKWQDNALVLLDQTRLPEEVLYETCSDVETIAQAIEVLMVRGAPAIGLAAAYGVVVGAQEAITKEKEVVERKRRVLLRAPARHLPGRPFGPRQGTMDA